MAEYYSRNLAREVMKGMKETAYQCKHTGGPPPIGYSVDPVTKRYLINEAEQVRLSKSLDGITRLVENIVKAVADGFANSSLLEKMNSLEEQREEIEQQISKIKPPIKQKAAITEDTLRQLLSRFKDEIADRNIPEIKKFIASYVKKVVIYKEHVDVIFKLNVVDLQDGAEGSRTPVRR